MKTIYLVCIRAAYPYYEDYCDTLRKKIKISLVILDDPGIILLEDEDLYIFCQSIPETFLNLKKDNIFLLNTEQLTVKNWQKTGRCFLNDIKRYLELGIKVIDYDLYQSRLTLSQNHIFIPYQYDAEENRYLSTLIQQTQKNYDIVFCPMFGDRRNRINSQLIEKGIKVVNATGWKEQRDSKIAEAKILINIHYDNDYQIFEHMRCDRWVLSGHLVITEDSLSDDLLDIKDLMIIEKYDNLVDRVVDVINNYDQYCNQFRKKLDMYKQSIIDEREKQLWKFFT